MSAAPEAGADGPVLAEPARQRLVQLAADVLGKLAGEDVPVPLRPYARFAPAKRVRLGAVALSAALDADDEFRGRVAEVVAEACPQLVESLQAGRATSASDPIDTAVVAYLTRPDGWQAVVEQATVRWTDQRAPLEAAAEETARLRAELTELRGRLKAETARAREAAADADAAREAAELRRTVRTRTGELRAAERERDEARAALDEARRAADAAAGAHDAELRRLRDRVAELERAAAATRRDTRAERDLDDARLRVLLDALTDAAGGIRRELDLPVGAGRPADVVAGAPPGSAGRTADDPAVLDRLLARPQAHLIIDGYNVTKTGYPDLSLADQRSRLIAALAAVQARSGIEVTIAFDGGARPPSQPRTPRGVRVLFSAPDELADDLIRRLVAAEPEGRAVLVATSDQAVVADVRRAGAWTVPSAVLLTRLG